MTQRATPPNSRAGTFLLAGFVLLAFIIALPVTFAARERASDAAGQAVLLARGQLSDLLSTVRQAESGLRGYIITGNQASVTTYKLALQAVPAELAALAPGDNTADFAQLQQITAQKLQQLAQAMTLWQTNQHQAAIALINTDLNLQTMQQLRALVGAMQADQSARFASIQAAEIRNGWLLQFATAIAVLGTLLLAIFAVRESRRQTTQLRAAEAALTRDNAALERRVAERTSTLQASEAQFRTLAETMPGFVFMADPAGANTYANPQYAAFCGITDADLHGDGWAGVVHPDERDSTLAAWKSRIAAGQPYEIEHRFRRHDGIYRWFLIRSLPLRGATGAITGWIGTATDIDERKQAEAALAEVNITLEKRVAARASELDKIFRLSRDILAVSNAEGRFLNLSPAWERITGIPVEQAIGRLFTDFIHPDDIAHTAANGGELLNAGQPINDLENRYRRADGSWAWLSWRAAPHSDDGLAYNVGRDITEERAREEQLRQSQKMELVGQLTGGVAHDFNNLLTVILGSLEMLQRGLPGAEPRITRRLETAMEGARRAATLTHRLLAFSRRQPLAPEALDVNRLIAGMSDMLHRSLGEPIAIEIIPAAGLWPALADANQLENAILNLAVNARDAMPDGGRLTIETQNSSLDEAYTAAISDLQPGQYVQISVTDTGTGMSEAVRAQVFEPFFTTKPVGQGTGLGLAQVYGFIKQSGGHAAISSEPGQGTTIKLYLPRLHGEAAAPPPRETTAAPLVGRGETILLVEDEEGVRNFAAEILGDLGYRIVAAENAATALALADAHPDITLLFTDVVLTGGMNGRLLANELQRRRPGLIVLFTTGYTSDAIIHHGRLDEGINFLGKPFTAASLAQTIRKLLDQHATSPVG